ncbi:MAG: beta-propeller domain-containing protein [Candidatus Aenigmarchaeota archaeon]|nr:beta-propeller domain-containing protein [Candidatus Aenigmarchaeota archaeon]
MSGENYNRRVHRHKGESQSLVYLALIAFLAAAVVLFAVAKQGTSQSELKKFSSPEELKNFLKANAEEYGFVSTEAVMAAAGSEMKAETTQRSDDYSTTNIQVAGVDEADIVKSDGKYIYAAAENGIAIIDAYPPESAKLLSYVNFTDSNVQEIYINGDKLVVFGRKESPVIARPYFAATFLHVYDVSDKSSPVLKRNLNFNGTYFSSRMIGDYVYAIITAPAFYNGDEVVLPFSSGGKDFPDIHYFDFPDRSYQFTNIASFNVRDDSKNEENKVFLLGRSGTLYVSDSNIYMVYQKHVKDSYAIERLIDDVIIPRVPDETAGRIREIRNSEKPYYQKISETEKTLREWLESLNPEEAARIMKRMEEKYAEIQGEIAKEMDKSVVHKIAISGGKIEYKTNGEVPGQPLNQFSMDEYKGYFRIATTTNPGFGGASVEIAAADVNAGSRIAQASGAIEKPAVPVVTVETSASSPPSQPPPQRPRSSTLNNVYVLDSDMKIAGRVEDLAPGERIFSARFMGDRAYLVTFVRTDPLFVIDLKDPANPRALGELKIPGVSDYLHPYDENHIIGVGRATEDEKRAVFKGLKISLFDVSDVSNPKELAKFEIGERGTDSEALRDHKAFLFSRAKNLLVIPALLAEKPYEYSWQGAYVFDVTLEKGFVLKGKVTHDEKEKDGEYYYPRHQVRRSLYIGNALYTISDKFVKANNLDSMEEISRVELPARA